MRSFSSVLLLLFLVAPAVLTGTILSYAGETSDAARLACLSLLGCWIFFAAVKWQSKLLYVVTVLWWLIFWLDSSLRSVSWFLFDSDPTAYFIVQSIANTSFFESIEFLQAHATTVIFSGLGLLGLSLVYFYILFKYVQLRQLLTLWQAPASRFLVIFFCTAMLSCYALRPARVLFPAIYWTQYYQTIQNFYASIQKHQQLHHQWQQKAQKQLVFADDFVPQQTHVLVLSESITSLNLSVCGYPRNTTPELAQLRDTFKIFCQAYSPYSSTINSLRTDLTDASILQPDVPPSESLLSYAKAAGFKVYWLSNQDDSYISSLFGSIADNTVYNNKRSGRSSSALDEELLPYYLHALADPYPKKLIILHFIGAHPNYANRYPPSFAHFSQDTNDSVEQDLKQRDISTWVQIKRNEYDNAILYQDWLITQVFTALKQHVLTGRRSFTYISDHGNEVGHELDYAGHSPNTKAGYQVPVILWHDRIENTGVDRRNVLNTADLDINLMQLMGIRDQSDRPYRYWLDKAYHFLPNTAFPYWRKSLNK